MYCNTAIDLETVRGVYSGPEADLWELVMGEQIHIGGFQSSLALAAAADIKHNTSGIDLCCCTGAGMRFLVRFQGVTRMLGVDATPQVIATGRQRCADQGFDGRIRFLHADACRTGLPDGSVDFVWGEDAWCYVADKPGLIAEAVRLVRPGGVVAFTDWIAAAPLSDTEAARLLAFMKFPSLLGIDEYVGLLEEQDCTLARAENTGRFAPYLQLYQQMLQQQLTMDALRILAFDHDTLANLAGEMAFMHALAEQGKIAQGMFVARKPETAPQTQQLEDMS